MRCLRRSGSFKRLIEGLKLIDNECIGLHIVSCAKLKKSNYSTRYEDKGQGVFVVRVNPRILEEEKWRKAAALEFLALIRRGFCAWEERDSSGVIIRTCQTAYGLPPDQEKRRLNRLRYERARPEPRFGTSRDSFYKAERAVSA
jgi:hypothetical protein